MSDPNLVRSGRMFVLSLDLIRERLGDRWPLRREAVSEFVNRQFRRDFGPHDQLTCVDDTTYLLLLPKHEREVAQNKASGLLTNVLEFFLGRASSDALGLGTVTAISDKGIHHRQAEPDQEGPSAASSRLKSCNDALLGDWSVLACRIEFNSERWSWTMNGDTEFEIVFLVEPVWSIESKAIVMHRLRQTVLFAAGDQRRTSLDLSVRDRIRLDVLAAAEATRLFAEAPEGHRFGLFLPVHHSTVTSSVGRLALLSRLEALGPLNRKLVPYLHGFERGRPGPNLREYLAPFMRRCLGVAVSLSDVKSDPSVWRDYELAALMLDLESAPLASHDVRGQLREFARKSVGVAPAVMACSLSARSSVLMAWAEGFTHVTGDALAEQTRGDLRPVRFLPEDLYLEKPRARLVSAP